MNRNDNPNQPAPVDGQAEEARIRRALGLGGTSSTHTHQQRPDQARQRHRFVADGAVPVVMLNRSDSESGGLKEKLAAAEAALDAERAAHAATRRSLSEANAAHQALQTRLAHAELAHNEVLAAERQLRLQAEGAAAAAPTLAAPEPPQSEPVEPKRRGRKPGSTLPRVPRLAREEKPVRWWTPSYRAKK